MQLTYQSQFKVQSDLKTQSQLTTHLKYSSKESYEVIFSWSSKNGDGYKASCSHWKMVRNIYWTAVCFREWELKQMD